MNSKIIATYILELKGTLSDLNKGTICQCAVPQTECYQFKTEVK